MRAATLLLLMVLLVAPLATAEPGDDRLIVPGVRIGKWRPGMFVDELVRLHGKADGTFRFLKGAAGDADFLREALEYRWEADDMAAFTFGRPLAVDLEVGRHNILPYRTTAHVGLQGTRADILGAYGKPTAASIPQSGYARLIYDALGIAFVVQERTAWINRIAVFKPGSARQIWKF